jgi:hypothetical protein
MEGGEEARGMRQRGRVIKVTFLNFSVERMGNGDRKKRDLGKSGILSIG